LWDYKERIMKSRYVKSLANVALMAFGILPLAAQAQLVDLGVATGYAINNAGQVVLSTGIYSNGTTTPLPALPGQTTPAVGAAINATGQVAGTAVTSVPSSAGGITIETVPVEFSNGTLTNLFAQSTEGYATGISSSAEIVGYSVSEDTGPGGLIQGYDYIGFIYANGTQSNLPETGVDPDINTPQGINDSGQITGIRSIPDSYHPGYNALHAYIYDSSSGTVTDLGQGAGYAINAAGKVTGDLDVITIGSNGDSIVGSYAFLYSNGTTTNLGTLPGGNYSTGNAINSTGQVVGSSNTGSSNSHAFFYNGAMNDLNTIISATDPLKPYVTLTSAVGINDSLLILANGVDSRTNQTHAYLYQASFIELAPAVLNFTQAVGGTSPGLSVTVTNTGTAAIPFGLPYVNGDFSGRADSCGTSLAPGAQCRVTVVFVPKVAGVFTGELTIPSAGTNYQVPLSGVAPITAQISAGSSAATLGQPLTLSWTVSAGSTCAAGSYSTNTAWTASNPPFTGTVPVSGRQTLTEIVNGTVTYTLNCTAPGVAAVSVSASVVWSWPTVTAALSASPTTITAGKSTTLTWKSSNATSCTATGGGPDDSWAGTKATSGSQTVTEPFALDTSSVTLIFGITCNSTTSGLSGKASASVTENQAAASSGGSPASTSSGGGGGALNPLSLAFLAGIFALRRVRARIDSR
jgi:probable HAF family extracellular repeat protein